MWFFVHGGECWLYSRDGSLFCFLQHPIPTGIAVRASS